MGWRRRLAAILAARAARRLLGLALVLAAAALPAARVGALPPSHPHVAVPMPLPGGKLLHPAASVPELVVQTGHSAGVECVAFSPGGRLLASGGKDDAVLLWDCARGRELRALIGHAGQVNCVAFSPDGRLLASGSRDGTIRLWDTSTGALRHVLENGSFVTTVAFSPDGRTLAGGGEVSFGLWDVASGRALQHQPHTTWTARFSPDGRWLETGNWDEIRVTDEVSGETRSLATAGVRPWAAAFRPAGRVLAFAGEGPGVHLVDPADGRVLRVLPFEGGTVYALAFSADGRTLFASDRGKALARWDVDSGRRLASLPVTGALALASAPERLAVARLDDPTVQLWRTGPAAPRPTGQAPRPDRWRLERTLAAYVQPIHSVANDPAWTKLAVSSGQASPRTRAAGRKAEPRSGRQDPGEVGSAAADQDAVDVLDLRSGDVRSLPAVPDRVNYAMAFGPKGARLATGDARGDVHLWEAETGAPMRALSGHTRRIRSLAFSPDGALLASGSDDTDVRVWDAARGRLLNTLAGYYRGRVMSLAFSPDASPSRRDDAPGPGGYPDRRAENQSRRVDDQGQVGFSNRRAENLLASADLAVHLWSLPDGTERMLTDHGPLLEGVAWSPDGRTLAAIDRDKRVHVLDVASGREEALLPGQAAHRSLRLEEAAAGLAWSPDGRMLAANSLDGAVALWDATGWRQVRLLPGHAADDIPYVAFGPRGRVVVTRSYDQRIRFWSARDGRLLATLLIMSGGDWLAASPQGFFDGTPGGWSRVLWRFGGNTFRTAEPEQYFSDFYQPGLLPDVLASGMSVRQLLRAKHDPRARLDLAARDRREPTVSVIAPAVARQRMVTVRLRLAPARPDARHPRPGGIRGVRLFRNGVLVWRRLGRLPGGVLSARIPVAAGPNRLTAYAFNEDNVKSRDAQAVVVGDARLRRASRAWILCIGINRYSDADLDLRFAASDARATADALRRSLPQRVKRIDLLVDGQATRAGILGAIRRLAQAAQPEDVVLISYAGHGVLERGHFGLLPHDVGRHAVIRDADLEPALAGIQAEHVALILDACHSGQALHAAEWRRGPLNARGLVQLAWEKGMDVLAASESRQAALEAVTVGRTSIRHGLLTYALVEDGLRHAPRSPRGLLARDWMGYAAARVPQMLTSGEARGRGIELDDTSPDAPAPVQHPQLFHRRESPDWIIKK